MIESTNQPFQSEQSYGSHEDQMRLQNTSILQYKYAGFIGRTIASVLDILVVVITIFVFTLFLLYLTPFVPRGSIEIIGAIFIAIIFPLYNIVCIYQFGTTLGKNVFGYKIISTSSRSLSIIRIILRETLGKYLSLSLLGIGFFWIIFDKKKQGWHDKILETYVIKDTQESLKKRVFVWLGLVIILMLVFFGIIKVGHLTGYSKIIPPRSPQPFSTLSPTPEDKGYSKIMMEAWRKKDPQICKRIKDEHPRWNCVTEIGRDLFTPDYCTDIEKDYDRNLCLSNAAASQKDIKICETILDNFRKNYCFVSVAEALKDVTLCNLVSNIANLHETCIINVGKELKDVSYCEKIGNPEAMDRCYNDFATYVLNDSFWCEKIVSPDLKKYCYQYAKPNPTQAARALEEFVTYCCKVKYICPNDGATIFTYIKNHADNKKRVEEMGSGSCMMTGKGIPPDTKDYKDDKCTQEWNPKASCQSTN